MPASSFNPDYADEIIEIVNRSPFPRHLGMRLIRLETDRVTVELDLDHCHLQPYGIAHGGVLSTLIDTATFWAVFPRIPAADGLVNIDLKLNYLQAVKNGRLRAEGYALRSGKSISYAEARVFNEQQELITHGTSTLKVMPGKGLRTKNPKFVAS
ncbi:MAG TPA: PaaI family thioesterase [Proteobacteria bacterium]|nr:PaaI family thioesterase [Pseudomonadota bacterium]